MSAATDEDKKLLIDAWRLVRDFQIAMGEPAPLQPTKLETERRSLRAKWMNGEISEFSKSDDLLGQVDSMIDLIYFALGTLCEMGVPPDEAFSAVHSANLRKLGADGRPLLSSEGRIIKPDGWTGPETDIRDFLARLAFSTR